MHPLLRFSGDVVQAYQDVGAEPLDRANAAHYCGDFEAAKRHYIQHGVREYIRLADAASYGILCETLTVRIHEALNEIARGQPVRDDDASCVLEFESGSRARCLALRLRALSAYSQGDLERGIGLISEAIQCFEWRDELAGCACLRIAAASEILGDHCASCAHAIIAESVFLSIHPREVFRRLRVAATGVALCPGRGWLERLDAIPAPPLSKRLMVQRSISVWRSILVKADEGGMVCREQLSSR